ncbi:glycoside hydrolase family 97 catalytic domain-containing protein [Haloarcula nitratireducens]|uniref:Glycoside hydrolase family 97 catalytic domain-containing protein n=1 Tax=Haloarcula nitratireducens TaxID=2487749 RepID=A0AAW4P7T3_9EURY|nr:glycoside hydrolase family 97 catalytic domain-containing protein [Halomicroarcula nitratireducens]MBX0293827.1 glycoside hydrolase family 97 catalytic domain-containing protein [Halomicroarcula nitratireducens]
MVDWHNQGTDRAIDRRDFLGGMTGLLAAAAYSLEVPEEVAAQVTSGDDSDTQTVTSPDGSIEVTLDVSTGVPKYSVAYGGTTYIDPSPVGFNFEGQEAFGTAISGSGPDVTVTGSESGTKTESWDPVWGDFASVSKNYNYLRLGLEETSSPNRSANLEVRVFDDGLGFRVVLDDDFGDFTINSENTEFNFSNDYTSWWIENEWVNPRFEQEYTESSLSNIPSGDGSTRPNDNYVRKGAHTPLTMETGDGTYLSVHESNLDDYSTLSLASQSDSGSQKFAAELAPLPDGSSVQASAPHMTPWRTVQIGDTPGDLVESQLVPLLAEPLDESAFPNGDTSWIEEGRKYVGIWWTMIAGSAKWEYKSDSEIENNGNDPAQYIHGARTERMKRYMTFANEHGIDSVLAEGWNEGWSTYPGDGTGFKMGTNDSYPDFDVPEVTDYGANLSNPVEMTMHNETAGNIVVHEDEINNENIFPDYESAGIRSIKNGYVKDPGLGFEGDGSSASHTQHCQRSVNHHRMVIQEAAANRQMLEIHEGIKPTGEIRTYPNVGAREVVKAQEYDGFGELGADVGRDHHVKLPYTRMLAGPTSYQPGIFDITFEDNNSGQIQTTLAKQLAMYPSYLGGIQMAADRMEAYVDHTFEVGEFVQAQSGKLDGMVTADKWRNCFGGHYVPIDPNREPDGATARFTVKNVADAGTYDLHIRYASDKEDNAQAVQDNGGPEATLVVNGSEQTISPSFTSYWDDWSIYTVSVDLNAGRNRIALRLGPNDVGGMNVNTIGVTTSGSGAPFPATYTNFSDGDAANENYDTVPEFDYIENVPVTWDETVAVDGAIGDYTVTAKRNGDEWYVGAMTDGTARDVTVTLDFLSGRTDGWTVTEYADAAETDVDNYPTSTVVTDYDVSAGDSVTLSMGASGGAALRIQPAVSSDSNDVVSGETYVLRNVNSGKALDVENASTSDGANVHQYSYASGDNQKWVVTDLGNSYYKLEAVHSGKALDVENASTSDGANVHQYEYVGGENQQWDVIKNADGSYRLIARHSGKALNVQGGSTSDGGNVEQYTYDGYGSQKWTLERL